ncbi:MAG: hypothetical protein JOZ57_13665, partial [Abitibacteriaceae bacterium]|nr:hypothetical protein [Abditibacteriaceae bacterium]
DIKERLGRWLTPDENPLYLHRVYRNQQPLGTILVRRVKGEYGAIEVVLAVDEQGKVRGLKLQRLREPEPIAQTLRSPHWLAAFEGQTADSHWRLGEAVPEVRAAAQPSAQAIVEGVRSSLILLDVIRHNKT